jgi:DNA-binding IclR family transcriptional regulator
MDELAARVEEARRQGYAAADGELEPGLAAVAAPVRRFDGRIIAAVNVSGPSFRFAPHLAEAGAEVARAAARLSAELQHLTTEVAIEATEGVGSGG